MIKLTIEEVEYTGPSRWEEITLDQFIKVCEAEAPTRLRDLLVAATNLNEEDEKKREQAEKEYDKIAATVTKRDLIQTFPTYYGELMSILTDIPKEVIDRIDGELRTEFFDKWMRYILLSCFYTVPVVRIDDSMEPYVPKKIESFELRGTTYLLPKTLKIYSNDIFLSKEPIISFAEASEIEIAYRELKDKGVNRMPMFIALYCRPDGEIYDESVVLMREPLMREVKMDVVWSVFFCIVELQYSYKSRILGFTEKEIRRHIVMLKEQD